METKKSSRFAAVLAIIALAVALVAFIRTPQAENTNSSTVLQHVLSSGTLRAGYIVYPPYISKDPKTGQLSGIFYDLTNQVGKQLGLKVEWIEEAGYGTIAESLSAGRYDVYAGIWPNPGRSKVMSFTVPVYYDAVYAYARVNDHRFDNNLDAVNSPQVKISTIDGELGDSIAQETFPNAKRVSLPQTSPFDQLELQVTSNKADITFISPTVADLFMQANPGTIRRVSGAPVRIYGATDAVKLGETDLQQMLSVTMQELINVGAVNKILAQYDKNALHLAQPYSK